MPMIMNMIDQYVYYLGCIVMTMLADEAGDLGLSVTDWQHTSTCPFSRLWRDESIRIGCVWTGTDWSIVTS